MVEVSVVGGPSTMEEEKPAEAVPPSKETAVKDVCILLDLRTRQGIHIGIDP